MAVTNEQFIIKLITYFRQPAAVACDAQCNKAWGRNSRPRIGDVYLADGELGDAPDDPGTYEGNCGKPQHPSKRMNKWCVRECERCVMVSMHEQLTYIGFSQRRRT